VAQVELPAYFGLGSNLGDRLGYLARACEMMYNAPGLARHAVSGVYETEPWGFADQPAFLNCVVRALTDLDPDGLLALARRIEGALGRERSAEDVRWGPRTIDVDILMVGDLAVNRPDLTVPHPRMWKRSFVLIPLLDLEPHMRAPDGRSLRAFAADLLDRNGVRRVRADLQGVFAGAENRLDQ
jgi:2-amino-4-hydroxy-6-hydroxymethyldihydropteridine diphosphokinase